LQFRNDFMNQPDIWQSFDTIVFDTLGLMVKKILDDVIKSNPAEMQNNGVTPKLQAWGKVFGEVESIDRLFKNAGKNIVYVVHQRESGEDGKPDIFDVSGMTRRWLGQDADFVGRVVKRGMVKEDRDFDGRLNKYYLDFRSKTDKGEHFTKDFKNLFEKKYHGFVEIPDLETVKQSTFLGDLIDEILVHLSRTHNQEQTQTQTQTQSPPAPPREQESSERSWLDAHKSDSDLELVGALNDSGKVKDPYDAAILARAQIDQAIADGPNAQGNYESVGYVIDCFFDSKYASASAVTDALKDRVKAAGLRNFNTQEGVRIWRKS